MEYTGVIAIDGPAGAGKSTVAKLVAAELGVNYLDTGALYRTVAYFLDSIGVLPEESEALRKELFNVSVEIRGDSVLLNGDDVSSLIRTPAVDKIASQYSALPSVREKLLNLQRDQALNGGLVADGRDMGTVVFPFAPVKIFLTAKPEVRARRRFNELTARGESVNFDDILFEIRERDEADANRAISPLRQAADAILLDTSNLNIAEVVTTIVTKVKEVSRV